MNLQPIQTAATLRPILFNNPIIINTFNISAIQAFDIFSNLYYDRLLSLDITDSNNINVLVSIVTNLSLLNKTKWEKIVTAYNTEYDPLENYRMNENGTNNTDTTNKTTFVGNGSTTTSNTSQSIESATPYDSTEYNDRNKIVGSDTVEGSTSSNNTQNTTATDKNVHSLTRYGNIGVTTSQQMLQAEFDVRQYVPLLEYFKDIAQHILLNTYYERQNNYNFD